MYVRVYDDLRTFEERIRPILEPREAEHSLMLGLAITLQTRPNMPYFMAEVVGDGETKLVAFYTNFLLILSEGDVEAIDLLIQSMEQHGIELPGVVGPPEMAKALAEKWTVRHHASVRSQVDQRIYRLEKVVWPQGVSGTARPATEGDLDLLLDWYRQFHEEATPEAPFNHENAERLFREKIVQECMYLWEDEGRPVAFTAVGRPTQHGYSVGPVFTPVPFRNHGYASALVAAASQACLDRGKRFTYLYTDLSNSTSNSIYQKIGYVPVCDSTNYWFESNRRDA